MMLMLMFGEPRFAPKNSSFLGWHVAPVKGKLYLRTWWLHLNNKMGWNDNPVHDLQLWIYVIMCGQMKLGRDIKGGHLPRLVASRLWRNGEECTKIWLRGHHQAIKARVARVTRKLLWGPQLRGARLYQKRRVRRFVKSGQKPSIDWLTFKIATTVTTPSPTRNCQKTRTTGKGNRGHHRK